MGQSRADNEGGHHNIMKWADAISGNLYHDNDEEKIGQAGRRILMDVGSFDDCCSVVS